MATQSNTPATASDEINDQQLAGISGGAPATYSTLSYSTASTSLNTTYTAPSIRYPTTSTTSQPLLLSSQSLPLKR